MLSECGLMLAEGADGLLPERSGVLTPVEAFGENLIHRLNSRGIGFEVVAKQANWTVWTIALIPYRPA